MKELLAAKASPNGCFLAAHKGPYRVDVDGFRCLKNRFSACVLIPFSILFDRFCVFKWGGRLECLKLLLLAGGSLEELKACRTSQGWQRLRPLHAACWCGQRHVAELLIGLRASLAAGQARITPLQMALERWKGQEAVARQLAALFAGSEEVEAGGELFEGGSGRTSGC